jgi:hypothetical protein
MREILVFAVGMLLATVLTVMGTFYFLKNYVLLHDSRDPRRPQAVARDQAVIARRLPILEQRVSYFDQTARRDVARFGAR